MSLVHSLENFSFDEVWDLLESSQQNATHPIGALWGRGHLEAELEKANVLGKEVEGRLVALIFYRDTSEGVEITWLATASGFQRRGYMKELLIKLVNDLERGEQLWLEVHNENQPALGLYESLGFKAQGSRKNYYSDGGDAQLFVYKPLQ